MGGPRAVCGQCRCGFPLKLNHEPTAGAMVASLLRLEKSATPEKMGEVITALRELLKAPELLSVREAFVEMLQWLLPKVIPNKTIPEFKELQEVDNMLAETMEGWVRDWKEEGREEGRVEGRVEGFTEFLLGQLEQKFGTLSDGYRGKLSSAKPESLLQWGGRVLFADSVDAVFH